MTMKRTWKSGSTIDKEFFDRCPYCGAIVTDNKALNYHYRRLCAKETTHKGETETKKA